MQQWIQERMQKYYEDESVSDNFWTAFLISMPMAFAKGGTTQFPIYKWTKNVYVKSIRYGK